MKVGDVALVQQLLARGADIEAKTNHGRSPLYIAVENCDFAADNWLDVVKLLLSCGADGTEEVRTAAVNGDYNMVERLLMFGAGVNLEWLLRYCNIESPLVPSSFSFFGNDRRSREQERIVERLTAHYREWFENYLSRLRDGIEDIGILENGTIWLKRVPKQKVSQEASPSLSLVCSSCRRTFNIGVDAIIMTAELTLASTGRKAVVITDGASSPREDLVASSDSIPRQRRDAPLRESRDAIRIVRESLSKGQKRTWFCKSCRHTNAYPQL